VLTSLLPDGRISCTITQKDPQKGPLEKKIVGHKITQFLQKVAERGHFSK
jgi:hypothetical protein